MTEPRLTVSLTFDWDAMSAWLGHVADVSVVPPAEIARGEFGAVAIPRILALLRSHEILATFFVPGHTALAYPDLLREIRDEGHEIAHHGWVHEYPFRFDIGTERANFERALEALDRVAGVRPVGYRAPATVASPRTVDVLVEFGMLYDSTFAAHDFLPYYPRSGDRWSSTEPYEFGRHVDLVELPLNVQLGDFPRFEVVPGSYAAQQPPSVVRDAWLAEFQYAYDECPGGLFDLVLHPQVIGRGARMRMLEELVVRMKERDVRFEPLADYARRWKAANPLERWLAENPILGRHGP